MECPHCKKQIPGKTCPACGIVIPEHSHYCLGCGQHLDEEITVDHEHEDGLDFEDRILCPDGTCTGIIVDGHCSECGRPYREDSTHEA
jgi:hypothetical protein